VKEIGFCVVGLGMGRARARMITQTEGARLVSVVDTARDRADSAGEEFGCKVFYTTGEAFQDREVDVVLVMTPSGTHAAVALEALEAGKHVITTKPMEVTVEKCDAMIEAAQKANRVLCVDFQERYRPANQQIKCAVENGLFGKLVLGEARLKWYRTQQYYDEGGWRGTWAMDGGGALANQSIHVIDLLYWIMGRPQQVIGKIYTMTHNIETEDLGMALLEFENGAVGAILGTTTFPANDYWGLEINGSEGGVIAPIGQEYEWKFLPEFAHRRDQLRTLFPQRNVIEDMVSHLHQGTPLVCPGEDGRPSIEILTAIYESARQGGAPVRLST